jgi:hypothetical protein
VNLIKTIAKICSQGFYRNLFCIFPSLIAFSMYFRNLYEFLESLKENEKPENRSTVLGPLLARGLGLLAQPNRESGQG